jgi:hypothetical protein
MQAALVRSSVESATVLAEGLLHTPNYTTEAAAAAAAARAASTSTVCTATTATALAYASVAGSRITIEVC